MSSGASKARAYCKSIAIKARSRERARAEAISDTEIAVEKVLRKLLKPSAFKEGK